MRKLTKRALGLAFVELCKSVPIQKISVKGFAKFAGISRQTFYNYFKDKADLMNYSCELVTDEIISKMDGSVEGMHYGASEMARACLLNTNFFSQVVKYETQNNFSDHFKKKVLQVYIKALRNKLNPEALSSDLETVVGIFSEGVSTYFLNWMRNGMKEAPEKVGDNIVAAMPECIKSILLKR
ncbi:MAG: TetR family transcriptional regulator [Clostridiales bacterium]|nr:TetR family transcriptional regulator [Clostridiales bacterium]